VGKLGLTGKLAPLRAPSDVLGTVLPDVARALGLARLQPVGWKSGLDRILRSQHGRSEMLVCPPLRGWVLVVSGLHLAPVTPAGRMAVLAHLAALDRRYGAAQHFLSDPGADVISWLRMERGQMTRAFGWSAGAVLVNHGATDPAETASGLPDLSGLALDAAGAAIRARIAAGWTGPEAGLPARIAGRWSVNPMSLDGPPSTCLIGALPRQ
jgi:hypothetical protein